MSKKSRRTGRTGVWFHQIVTAVGRFVEAVRHVRSGGQTTRTRAVRRATRPPRKCPECRQTIPHSHDWRDHL